MCVCASVRGRVCARVMGALLVLSRRTSGPPLPLGGMYAPADASVRVRLRFYGSTGRLHKKNTRLSSYETELSRNLQLRWNLSLFMALRSRTGFYRQEVNRTVWEVPERYRDLKQIGTGAYGTVW